MQIETFNTSRLQLRKFTPEVYNCLFSNYPEAEIQNITGCENEDQYQKLRKKYEGGIATYNRSLVFFQLTESSSNTIIGGCGFHNWATDHNRAEIGYHLDKEEFKNRGFMKEALAFVLKYGFEEMSLHRIEALVSPTNIPSLKLIKHFGFQEEGLLKEHYLINGRHEDSLVFGLLKKDYQG